MAPIGSATGIPTDIIAGSAGKIVTNVAATGTLGLITLQASGNIEGKTTTTKTGSTTAPLKIVTTQFSANAGGDIDFNAAIPASAILTLTSFNAGGDAFLGSTGGLTTLGFSNDSLNSLAVLHTNAITQAAAGGGGPASIGGMATVSSKGDINMSIAASLFKIIPIIPKEVKILAILSNGFENFGQKFSATPSKTMGSKLLAEPAGTSAAYDISNNSDGGISIQSDHSIYVSGTATKQLPSLSLTSIGGMIQSSDTLSAKTISLTTVGSDIGTSLAPLSVNASTLSVVTGETATGQTGNAYINSIGKSTLTVNNTNVGGMTLVTAAGANLNGVTTGDTGLSATTGKGTSVINSVSSTGSITVLTAGTTNIGTVIASGGSSGDISVKNSTGTLTTLANSQIYALNGSILLENTNATAGKVVVGVGSKIETGSTDTLSGGAGGDVTLAVGESVATNTTFTSPNITATTQRGGTIFYGTQGVTAVSSKSLTNTVTAKGANVIFSGPKVTSIKLSGNTTIVADPQTATGTFGSGSMGSPLPPGKAGGAAPPGVDVTTDAGGYVQPQKLSADAIVVSTTSTPATITLSGGGYNVTSPSGVSVNGPTINMPNTASLTTANTITLTADPPGDVIKAIACNTSEDAGYDKDARWITETEIEKRPDPGYSCCRRQSRYWQ